MKPQFIEIKTVRYMWDTNMFKEDGTTVLNIASIESIDEVRMNVSLTDSICCRITFISGQDPRQTSIAEGERLKKILLKDDKNPLAGEVSDLTRAIRDLWNLLRARMH